MQVALSIPEVGGQHSEFVPEIAAEVFGIVESHLIGDFGDGALAFLQELRGPFEADEADEFQVIEVFCRLHFFPKMVIPVRRIRFPPSLDTFGFSTYGDFKAKKVNRIRIMQYDWGGNTEDLLFGIDNIRIQKNQ